MESIETVCVDEAGTGYGTFQSHNQKVLRTGRGYFMTHIRTRNPGNTAQQWRLSHSPDGARFLTLFEAVHATNPPAIESDEDGNVYLGRPDFVDGHAYLYRFLAADGFSEPRITRIPGGGAGKVCMLYDPGRRQIYFFAHYDRFYVLGLDGTLRRSTTILAPGRNAYLQYPHLSLDSDGVLHAAWTTEKHGVYLYWDIHHMLSRDGGANWEKMDGMKLQTPVVSAEDGPTDRITLDDEFEGHTWLSNFMAKDGKLHFIYLAQSPHDRQHYVRYDIASGRREIDLFPVFKGETITLRGLDGFFASGRSRGSPLYCVMQTPGKAIGCLRSDDNGSSWHDHAVSSRAFIPYSVGGFREVTQEGMIIGSFTHETVSPDDSAGRCPIFFLKCPGQEARERVPSHAGG